MVMQSSDSCGFRLCGIVELPTVPGGAGSAASPARSSSAGRPRRRCVPRSRRADRDRVLAVRAACRQRAGGALGQVRGGAEYPGQQPQDHLVGLAQDQDVAGLGDVLRGRSLVHPPATLTSGRAQLGDQGHQRVTGLCDATLDPGHVQEPGGRTGPPGMRRPGPAPWPPSAITTSSGRCASGHLMVGASDHNGGGLSGAVPVYAEPDQGVCGVYM
jgi:hypothetical protein